MIRARLLKHFKEEPCAPDSLVHHFQFRKRAIDQGLEGSDIFSCSGAVKGGIHYVLAKKEGTEEGTDNAIR